MGETKKPVQIRSVITRENLIKAALSMYAKKGYHKTTVDEIAAEAGLSTGIAYRYFKNKKDILLSAVEYGAENILAIADIKYSVSDGMKGDIRTYLRDVLINFEQLHMKYRDIHEELEGLQHTDDDVRKLYNKITAEKMENVIAEMKKIYGASENIREKTYLAVGLMEQHCHMKMNSDEFGVDHDVMREMTVDAVIDILS